MRGHRERCGVAHDGSTTGWSYDKLGNETAAAGNTPRTGEIWTDHSQLSGITAGGTTYDLVHAGATNAERTKLGSTTPHSAWRPRCHARSASWERSSSPRTTSSNSFCTPSRS
ncbi:hypothetical protein [Streptomyces sp. MA15]|uniref:hypothetical protein n=1 Tax=Streptomyces sp. MA15 TaxID=3055061 RepID=UPI0025B0CABF|nr:hypothetical protein [Streptomyces sp. MA15]MDN3271196.1 hypothetical protein [Streptomyces sp. MA15]